MNNYRTFLKLALLVLLALCGILLMSNIASVHKTATAFLRSSSSSPTSSSPASPTSSSNAASLQLSIAHLFSVAGKPSSQSLTATADVKANNVTRNDGSGSGDGDVKADPNLAIPAPAKPPQQTLPPSSLPSCPEKPPNLLGYTPTVQDVLKPLATLEKEWGETLLPGGHYHPPDCHPRERTAIIIPCRNRWEHLRILLNHLIPFLIRQQLHFTLFVIESDQASHFNKGILLNAGYLESQKLGNYTCFVFHDVDLLPLNDNNLYRCGEQPRHLAVAIDKFSLQMPYGGFFGGVLALSKSQYEKVNGHSNVYFGWGGEDDDIEHRVSARGFRIFRMPVQMSQYHMIRHVRDKGNEPIAQKMPLVSTEEAVRRMDAEGVHQVLYHRDWVHTTPLYTWIHLTVNEKEVIQNFPDYVKERFMGGLIYEH